MTPAQGCCGDDDAARAARARRRVAKKLRRRPSSSTSLKARKKLRLRRAHGKPGATTSSVAIQRKMDSLRRLVVAPAAAVCGGCERLDELLLHAAGYIMRLQMQVRVMQIMVHALDNPKD